MKCNQACTVCGHLRKKSQHQAGQWFSSGRQCFVGTDRGGGMILASHTGIWDIASCDFCRGWRDPGAAQAARPASPLHCLPRPLATRAWESSTVGKLESVTLRPFDACRKNAFPPSTLYHPAPSLPPFQTAASVTLRISKCHNEQ